MAVQGIVRVVACPIVRAAVGQKLQDCGFNLIAHVERSSRSVANVHFSLIALSPWSDIRNGQLPPVRETIVVVDSPIEIMLRTIVSSVGVLDPSKTRSLVATP